jgi:photosystem II stability/assembly factor-like uncharacterized protein
VRFFLTFSFVMVFICTLTAQWQELNSPTNNRLWSVCYTDTSTGWIVGVNGIIIHTTDAGMNWEFQSSGTNDVLYSAFFVDGLNGWIVGANGVILHTTNAGISWNNQSAMTSGNLWAVFFINQNVGWAASDYGTIIHTTNGGTNWSEQSVSVSHGFYDIFFADENNGWAIGGTNNFQIIVHTTNGGNNWITQSNENGDWLYSVYFVDDQNGWISGENGTILHTTNGGNNWVNQNSGGNLMLESIYFTDNNNGWISGENGIILHTTDAGLNWLSQNSSTNQPLYNIFFSDPSHGWAVGESGTIVRSPYITPVELTFFSAALQENQVILSWATATEINNNGFEIQRKTGKGDWKKINFVEGYGTTTEIHDYEYTDDLRNLLFPTLNYRLKQIDYDGNFEYSNEVLINNIAPVQFSLGQNYPNPFNPNTIIQFSIPQQTFVNLSVYNISGELISVLVNDNMDPGYYEKEFDASKLSSGIYLYQLKAGTFIQTKKMVLMK